MLYVYGGVAVDPARIEEVTRAASVFAEKCRDEDGCVEYSLAWNAENPAFLRLLEVWEPTSAHAVHVDQPHVKEWTTFVQGAATTAPQFTKFVVDVVDD